MGTAVRGLELVVEEKQSRQDFPVSFYNPMQSPADSKPTSTRLADQKKRNDKQLQ